MRPQLIAIFVIAFITVAVAPPLAAVEMQSSGSATSEADVIEQFQERIEQYMVVRRRLANEIASPAANSTAVQVTNASDALAAAIQRSQPKLRNGSFFEAPTTTDVFKRRVIGVVREANLVPVLAAIDDDGPASVRSDGLPSVPHFVATGDHAAVAPRRAAASSEGT